MAEERLGSVLVVDDTPEICQLVELQLTHQGYRVRSALNSRSALEQFIDEPPDLVLLDVDLGGEDGVELCKTLRTRPAGSHTNIVMLTNHDDEATIKRAYAAGADDYLIKPITWPLLFNLISYSIQNRRALTRLEQSERQFRSVFESPLIGMLLIDGGCRLLRCNDHFVELLGYEREELLRRTLRDLSHPDDPLAGGQTVIEFLEVHPEGRHHFENRLITKQGEVVHADIGISMVPEEEGGERFAIAMVKDVTTQRESNERLRIFARLFENASEGMMITDERTRIIDINPAFTQITGYTPEALIGQRTSIFKSGLQGEDFYREMWRQLEQHGHWEGEFWNRKQSGKLYPQHASIKAIHDEEGKVSNYFSIIEDITLRKEQEVQLIQRATHDNLTGLPNRTLLQDRLSQELNKARRSGESLAVLFFDLDRFKPINDQYGHDIGDLLLQAVAGRVASLLRRSDTVARYGGDEFIVVVPQVETIADVFDVAEKILGELGRPFEVGGESLWIGCSIGIALSLRGEGSYESLIKAADEEMYRAKKQGRNCYSISHGSLALLPMTDGDGGGRPGMTPGSSPRHG